MASVLTIPNARDGYVALVQHVLEHGEEVSPRGQLTRELEDVTVVIEDPFDTLPIGVGRNVNAGIGAVEACQLLAGVSMPSLVLKVGPQFKSFTEDNGLFHGAYGLRTRGAYARVIERLQKDPDTRQAVVALWRNDLDLEQDGKRDYPCTLSHSFRIRRNRLNMSVKMRSNDVWRGAAYDYFQFTRVQIAVASVLGIEPGTYAHTADSLHIYESDIDAAGRLRLPDKVAPWVPAVRGSSWFEVEENALLALEAVDDTRKYRLLYDDERWYADAMLTAVRRQTGDLR